MSLEDNKAVLLGFISALNTRNIAALRAVTAPDLAERCETRWIPFMYGTFGNDHHIEVTDMLAERDRVWARLATSSSGLAAEWRGLAPTHKAWTNEGVCFARVADGKVVSMYTLFDDLNLVEQLRGTIAPPNAG